ncbi:MAG: DUF58 domain-containing protein [Flavobacteriales bacterium]|mgnify:FL=1|nr:DUF58 domain-containing protein [Flavobacteriales bacterium]|tara:strand:- start:3317 stop:4192 length:876 start_codon:yes stop_codon:yes gene_type:complete
MKTSELLNKVRQIEIKTKGLSNHIFAGEYHTAFKGTGMAFSEVREYVNGDDLRTIDWNVTARYNSPFVKVFEEEREMTVILLIDVSASTNFGTNFQFKRDLCTEIAAIFAFSAIKNNDKVGVILFSNEVEKYIPPQKGKKHILRLIQEIINFQPKNKKTNIESALEYLNMVIKKRSISFIISDFISANYQKSIKIIKKRHDIIGIKLNDKSEKYLPNIGIIPLQNSETGEKYFLDSSNKKVREKFLNEKIFNDQKIKIFFQQNGIDLIELNTGEEYIKPLMNFFKKRGSKK